MDGSSADVEVDNSLVMATRVSLPIDGRPIERQHTVKRVISVKPPAWVNAR